MEALHSKTFYGITIPIILGQTCPETKEDFPPRDIAGEQLLKYVRYYLPETSLVEIYHMKGWKDDFNPGGYNAFYRVGNNSLYPEGSEVYSPERGNPKDWFIHVRFIFTITKSKGRFDLTGDAFRFGTEEESTYIKKYYYELPELIDFAGRYGPRAWDRKHWERKDRERAERRLWGET